MPRIGWGVMIQHDRERVLDQIASVTYRLMRISRVAFIAAGVLISALWGWQFWTLRSRTTDGRCLNSSRGVTTRRTSGARPLPDGSVTLGRRHGPERLERPLGPFDLQGSCHARLEQRPAQRPQVAASEERDLRPGGATRRIQRAGRRDLRDRRDLVLHPGDREGPDTRPANPFYRADLQSRRSSNSIAIPTPTNGSTSSPRLPAIIRDSPSDADLETRVSRGPPQGDPQAELAAVVRLELHNESGEPVVEVRNFTRRSLWTPNGSFAEPTAGRRCGAPPPAECDAPLAERRTPARVHDQPRVRLVALRPVARRSRARLGRSISRDGSPPARPANATTSCSRATSNSPSSWPTSSGPFARCATCSIASRGSPASSPARSWPHSAARTWTKSSDPGDRGHRPLLRLAVLVQARRGGADTSCPSSAGAGQPGRLGSSPARDLRPGRG